MFGLKRAKKQKIASSFSIMLAEELLRAELEAHYKEKLGYRIQIFQLIVVASPPATYPRTRLGAFQTEMEKQFFSDKTLERFIDIKAIIGPFEKLYPANPAEDLRCHMRTVEANCRLFSVEESVTKWKPHFLHVEIKDHWRNQVEHIWKFYETGSWGDAEIGTFRHQRKDSENPCAAMCASYIKPMLSNPELSWVDT
jgi:hypothetical protein